MKSDKREAVLNIQCLVSVLLSAIKRQFRLRKRKNLQLILAGHDEESEEEEEELIYDLVDSTGRPKRLYLHLSDPAAKYLTGRMTYFVASVKSIGSIFKFSLNFY